MYDMHNKFGRQSGKERNAMSVMGMNAVMCCCRMRFSRLDVGGQVHSSTLCCADV